MSEPLLSVQNLVTTFRTDRGLVRAVDEVSFEVGRAETLALVGESGCGKSVTALSIMRLVASPPGAIAGGKIEFSGRDLLGLSEREMRALRGAQISMIFQEPMTSLNPVYTIGSQIVEAIRIHRSVSRRAARERAVHMLELVGIPSPAERVDTYPHQLSGGMRQRVMIAMALSCEPKLLIADEPTTALDVTIQAQILDLLRKLQAELGMSIVFITHDLGIVAEFASRVAVMYAGRVVEQGTVHELFKQPLHPYTRGLLASIPPRGASIDVTIQAQILDLLRKLQAELGMSIVFITHDLGIVAEFASRVAVMYAGRVVEQGTVHELFKQPLHPYTRGLLASIPPRGASLNAPGRPRRLPAIEGMVPSPFDLPPGCRFADRCALRASKPPGFERCTEQEPELRRLGDERRARCHYSELSP